MVDTIKNSFVPLNADGTADRIDQSLQDDLDTEWYRREKLAPKGTSIPVIYGTMTVDGIDAFHKKYLYSKKRGNRWRGKWRELKEQVLSMQVFCYGGSYTIDEITYPEGVPVSWRNEYDGTQTTPPTIIYNNRNYSKWGTYGWDNDSIGAGLVFCEFLGDNSRGFYTQQPIPATITRTDVNNNHADVIVDYLTNKDYGVGWDVSLLDLTSFNDAKTYLTTQNPSTSEPFLNCNFALDTSDSFKDNLNTLLSECRGALIESGGKIRLIIERPINPVIEINESNVVGTVQTESIDASKRFNRVIAKYFDQEAKAASMVVYPTNYTEHTNWLAEDNGVINQGELSLKTVTNVTQAFNQARIMALLSRGGESLTVTVHGEATLLEVFDVVTVNYPDLDFVADSMGNFPEYIVEEVQPDLEKQTAKVKLRYYDSTIYPIQDGRTDPPSPPRVPQVDDVGTITFTEVTEKDNNKVFIRWDYEGDYAPTYNVGVYKGSIAEDNLEFITSTELEQITTPPLTSGAYILELVMRDRLGTELLTTSFNFTTTRPPAPVTINTTADYSSITIEPSLPSSANADNTEFVYYLGVTNVEANAKSYGSGDVKQVTGLKPDTTHHIWVYTKTPFGLSSTAAYKSQKTEKIPNDIGGTRFEQRFKLSQSQPATPTGDQPVGWFTHPQTGAFPNWISIGEKNPDGTLVTGTTWSVPVLYDAVGDHTWTVYADDPLGTNISVTKLSSSLWIGNSYNKDTETPDLSDAAAYSWKPVSGDNFAIDPVSGEVTAGAIKAGHITSGEIKTNHLYAGVITAEKINTSGLDLRGHNVSIKMAPNAGDAPVFSVNKDGDVTMSGDVTISGSGTIGGNMTIEGDISSNNLVWQMAQSGISLRDNRVDFVANDGVNPTNRTFATATIQRHPTIDKVGVVGSVAIEVRVTEAAGSRTFQGFRVSPAYILQGISWGSDPMNDVFLRYARRQGTTNRYRAVIPSIAIGNITNGVGNHTLTLQVSIDDPFVNVPTPLPSDVRVDFAPVHVSAWLDQGIVTVTQTDNP